jgi:hypothetical protein
MKSIFRKSTPNKFIFNNKELKDFLSFYKQLIKMKSNRSFFNVEFAIKSCYPILDNVSYDEILSFISKNEIEIEWKKTSVSNYKATLAKKKHFNYKNIHNYLLNYDTSKGCITKKRIANETFFSYALTKNFINNDLTLLKCLMKLRSPLLLFKKKKTKCTTKIRMVSLKRFSLTTYRKHIVKN